MKPFIFFIILIVACPHVHAQMMSDITSDITTNFATYHPYEASFSPQIVPYSVEADFSNVLNFDWFEQRFSEEELDLLRRNHFVVKKSRYTQLYDIYNESTYDATPVFVTTDAVLHIYHVLFDKMLARIEMSKFVPALFDLTNEMILQMESIYQSTADSQVEEAVRHNMAFLYVARNLLWPMDTVVPPSIAELVDAELALIAEHDGFHYSPILGNFSMLDYSQFIPRGHYTQNDTLKSYFRAMMWYGWTIFTMEPELFGELSTQHTLQSLLLTQRLFYIQNNMSLWKSIYLPTVFFVGKTDDPSVFDYKNIADSIYGMDFIYLSPDSLADSLLLHQFMEEAQKLDAPAISNWVYGTFITYKGFRFMGQRFIPDSYMFANLVYPYVGGASGQRWMPKGLDIMAILGSERAYAILDSVFHETAYLNYSTQIEKFHTEFSQKPASEWAQNLYWNWLYCLMPLLYQKAEGYPCFMRTLAWAHKELFTALASWAELRHDAILYAKQSMSPCGIPPSPPHSYVEPNPYLYARLASLVKFTRDGLSNRDLLITGYREKLDLFESLLLFLRDVSIKELENIPLSVEEHENIFCFGKVMENLVSEIPDPHNPWDKDTDDMAVIADVHTDSNTDLCLEEGVGYPLEIYVIVPEGGILRLTQGAIFSYYEFKQAIAQRLTDEEWREMLRKKTAPDLPKWSDTFIDIASPQPDLMTVSPENIYDHEFTYTSVNTPEKTVKEFHLFQNYPNPFNPLTQISFTLTRPAFVRIVIYNNLGQELTMLLNRTMKSGLHQVEFNAQDIASGIYFYQIQAGEFNAVRKMIVLK